MSSIAEPTALDTPLGTIDRRAGGQAVVLGELVADLVGLFAVDAEQADQPLLHKLLGDPAMMEHLGGPESSEKLAERQARYEKPGSRQFKIVDAATGEGVGHVGYWEREWRGEPVFEIGWSVIPAFQGRGLAAARLPAPLTSA